MTSGMILIYIMNQDNTKKVFEDKGSNVVFRQANHDIRIISMLNSYSGEG